MSEADEPVPGAVTLADIEKSVWRAAQWQAEQRDVDHLLALVRAYARGPAEELCPCVRAAGYEGVETASEPLGTPAGPDAPGGEAEAPQTGAQGAVGAEGCGEAGAEASESPVEVLEEPVAGDGPTEAVNGAQTAVQAPGDGLHGVAPVFTFTGPVTLVFNGGMPEAPEAVGATTDGTRDCRKCKRTFPLTEYFKDSSRPDGRKTVCRECENERRRDQRRAQRAAKAKGRG